MSFTGQSTCLQGLLLLVGLCNGQSGSRTGSGHRYGGGRGFAVLNTQENGSANEGDQQEVDQRIVILLLVLLALAVVGLLWQWCSYCHKIVNPPVILKDDPEQQRLELEARYRALQQRFREGQTRSTDSFNPEPPISALDATNLDPNWRGNINSPPEVSEGDIGWQISSLPPPPSSNFMEGGDPSSSPSHSLNPQDHSRSIQMTTTTTLTEEQSVLITISPP